MANETYFMGLPTTRVMQYIANARRAQGDRELAALQGQQGQQGTTQPRSWMPTNIDSRVPMSRFPQPVPWLKGANNGQPQAPQTPAMPHARPTAEQSQEYLFNSLGQLPAYKEGGMVGPGGTPIRPQLGANKQPQQQGGQQMNPDMAEGQIRDMMSQNPQVAQQIQMAAQQAMASGELTPQELDMAVKLAKLALRDPSMYPQIRNFAIQNGLATEQDLPQQYDQGLVYAILMLGEAMQAQGMGAQQQDAPGQMPQQPQGQGDGAVNITAHEGEYVIPKHVVGMKGREFFDSLVSKYDPNTQQ